MSKKKKKTKAGGGKSKILYWIAGIVILIPVLLLGWIYLSAKESSGSPTVGSRFDNSLNPAITEEQMDKVKSAMKLDGVESVEVNLISATLRINIDTKDDASSAKVKSIMNEAYDKVNDILPIKKYFTNNDSDKMYDLEVHVYNFIPDVKTKTAAAKKPNVSTPSSPKNKSVAEKLLKQQEEAAKKNK